MKTPKTPIEFDYDLWTTEDGKCMVRVKITGEITEVDREVMKALRAEEKRIRRALRSNEGTVKDGIEQMCEILSISTKTGYRILREGKICCLKVGRAYRIPKAHLFTFLCIGCGEAVTA